MGEVTTRIEDWDGEALHGHSEIEIKSKEWELSLVLVKVCRYNLNNSVSCLALVWKLGHQTQTEPINLALETTKLTFNMPAKTQKNCSV